MADVIDLRYTGVSPWDLQDHGELGTCTVARISGTWHLAFFVATTPMPEGELLIVAINQGGQHVARGAADGRPMWGMSREAPGRWVVTPSINFPDRWHEYVAITGVPDPAPWS